MLKTKPGAKPEPTVSSDDPELYKYTSENAPEDVVINVGQAPLMIVAPHAVNDPQRVEVGDRRRGAYYLEECLGLPTMLGLMQLKRVDKNRLEQVNKIRRIRVGEEEPDWVKEARRRSGEQPDGPPPVLPGGHGLTPLQRAARGL